MRNKKGLLSYSVPGLCPHYEDIIKILELADFKMTKAALGDLFRNEDHPGYVEAGDQVLRNFLNGLIIYKRGPLPDTKKVLKKEDDVAGKERKDR